MTTTLAEQLADARRQLASERNPNTRKFWKNQIYALMDQKLQKEGWGPVKTSLWK